MAQACHEQETGGTPVSLFKVKQVLQCHGLRGCQLRNKPLFQKLTLSSFTENFSCLNEPAKRLLENSLSFSPPKRYVWMTQVEASKLKNSLPPLKHGGALGLFRSLWFWYVAQIRWNIEERQIPPDFSISTSYNRDTIGCFTPLLIEAPLTKNQILVSMWIYVYCKFGPVCKVLTVCGLEKIQTKFKFVHLSLVF